MSKKKSTLHSLSHLLHPRSSNNQRASILRFEWQLILSILSVIFFGFVLLTNHIFSYKGGVILGYATNITVEQVVDQTNQTREVHGVGRLQLNTALNLAAQKKAADMFANQYWAHISPTGKEPWDFIKESGYEYQSAGENLARDFYTTQPMIQAWMASPSHRANMLNDRYTEIGVAVINGVLEGTQTTLVVQVFGRPINNSEKSFDERNQLPSANSSENTIENNSSIKNEIDSNDNEVNLAEISEFNNQNAEISQPVTLQRTSIYLDQNPPLNNNVLAALNFIMGEIRPWPSISPLQFAKALGVTMIAVISIVLLYDWVVFALNPKIRLVGQNLAHLLYLALIGLLIISFQSGMIF